MTKNEIKEVENFIDYMQDKVDEVYKKETQRAVDRFLKRIKNGVHSD